MLFRARVDLLKGILEHQYVFFRRLSLGILSFWWQAKDFFKFRESSFQVKIVLFIKFEI